MIFLFAQIIKCHPIFHHNSKLIITAHDAVIARLKDLEKKIEKGVVQTAPVALQLTQEPVAAPVKPVMPKAISEDIRQIVGGWRGIVSKTGQPLKTHLKNARLSLGGDNQLAIIKVISIKIRFCVAYLI